jgi:hypothetical protein
MEDERARRVRPSRQGFMVSVLSHGPCAIHQRLPIDSLALPLPPGVCLGEVLAGKYRLDSVLGIGAIGVVVGARTFSSVSESRSS